MKISILTATYNRADFLPRLYKSIINNEEHELEIEWLIMDDGSQDNTKEVVQKIIEDSSSNSKNSNYNSKEINKNNIEIKYNYQENRGKMEALNNLMQYVTGDLIVDCDSDDYFSKNAFKIIEDEFKKEPKSEGKYAICFLKQKENGQTDGTNFKNETSTMFDLYFKEGTTGEKNLVYYADIRKKYKHETEKNEKFITEARMYHKMDKDYKIKCINKAITIGEYQENGYTSNIQKTFIESPNGYYKYFEEILEKDFKGVTFNKRLYAIKHFILFTVLTNQKLTTKKVKNILNKIIIRILYWPGKIKSRQLKNKINISSEKTQKKGNKS